MPKLYSWKRALRDFAHLRSGSVMINVPLWRMIAYSSPAQFVQVFMRTKI